MVLPLLRRACPSKSGLRSSVKQIMPRWMPRVQFNQAPPDALCQNIGDLHLTQVVEAVPDAKAGDPRHSILGASMRAGNKSRKLYFTPAAWLSCLLHLSTSNGGMAFTEREWQN